jgi:phage terminase large subunit
MANDNVFQQWVDSYHPDPVLFVQEVLGVDPDPWQIKFLQAIARGDRKISVRSGHGVGKSTASSWAMLWYFMTRSAREGGGDRADEQPAL